MKARLKTMLILIGIVISFKYAYAVDCNAIPGGCDNCDPWQVNERFGNTLVIPTGDPTCYFVVDFLTRTCYCDGYIKREIKINGIRKEGSNCANVTDREVFTKIYTFLLFISRDLFGVDYPTFEVGIMTPACYQWVGNTLVDCGSGCCRKSWVVTYNGRRVEVSSGGVENVACSGVVGGGCQNLCDSLDVLDGALYYPSWPSMCLDQDPCPTSPWQFNPYENYIITDVQGCRVIAYYEEADCPGTYKKFRLKFIKRGPGNSGIRTGVFITQVIRQILRKIKDLEILQGTTNVYYIWVDYSCWTRGNDRIYPCENGEDCCVINYQLDPSGPTLIDVSTIYNPNIVCPTDCYYECDTLVDPNLMPRPSFLPRSISQEEPQGQRIVAKRIEIADLKIIDEGKTSYVVIKGNFNGETFTIEVYNLLGTKVLESVAVASSSGMIKFALPQIGNGVYFLILKSNVETILGKPIINIK
jgi:hypothetical protein